MVYKLKEAAKGYTCHEARHNRRRGVCRTGIDYAHYDRISEDCCLFCEIYLGGEISNLMADTCNEGNEPWPEDADNITLGMALAGHYYVDDENTLQYMAEMEYEAVENRDRQGEEEDDEDDEDEDDEDEEDEDEEDDDDEEGGAKVR